MNLLVNCAIKDISYFGKNTYYIIYTTFVFKNNVWNVSIVYMLLHNHMSFSITKHLKTSVNTTLLWRKNHMLSLWHECLPATLLTRSGLAVDTNTAIPMK